MNVSLDMLKPGFQFLAPGKVRALYCVLEIGQDRIRLAREARGQGKAELVLPVKAVLNILNSPNLSTYN